MPDQQAGATGRGIVFLMPRAARDRALSEQLEEKPVSFLGSTERRLIILVGAIQFITSIVFSMVSALGPMFSRDLGIPAENIGTIAGSYMMAGAASGFVGTLYLDRFDRRRGLAVSLAGVVFGLIMTALAPNQHLLIASRVLTGLFSGPCSAFSIAIVIDNVPAARRGGALGSIASFQGLGQIIGVPVGLKIASFFDSWRYPFFAIALVGALLGVWVITNLAPQRAHLVGDKAEFAIRQRLRLLRSLLIRPACLVAWGIQLTGIVPLVAITTIMAVFLVNNLGFPAKDLPTLYFVGGAVNFAMARVIGRGIDRIGAVPVSLASTVLLTAAIVLGYMGVNPGIPLLVIFPIFFVTSTARLVVGQTVLLRIPRPEERAGFQSLAQSVLSSSMGLSALAIPLLLGSTPDGKLTGVNPFAVGVIAVTWLFPWLVQRLERLLDRGDKVHADLAAALAEQQTAE